MAGTCINEGCTPTKTMVASARVAHVARRAPAYGVHTGTVAVDLAAVRERKRAIVESWRASSEQRLLDTENLDLLMGVAWFTGPHTLLVELNTGGTRLLEADLIVIDTGTRPAVPRIAGLAETAFLDSTAIMELDTVPEHLLILGGGYVALEFAQMFRRFGSRVTVVQRNSRLLPREDPDVSQALAELLEEDGIAVMLEAHTEQVRRREEGIELTLRAGEGDGAQDQGGGGPEGNRTVTGSTLLVATGRVPNTELLQLGTAGIEIDERGYIAVDDRLETSSPGVYAVGDVKGGPAFTHISYDDFRILRANLLEDGHASTTGRLVPYTVFVDPQLGRVGLTEQDAHARGYDVGVACLAMSSVSRALEVDEPRGFMKAVVDRSTDLILGAAVLGLEGGEIMAILQTAMMGGLTAASLREAVYTHPTLAESLNTLFSSLD